MKKSSTVQAFGNEIFKGHKLTIGLDLGDRWSFYCVWMKRAKSFWNRKYRRHRFRDRNTFPLGKPAVKGAGTRGARGARAKGGIDHQEQSKR